MNSKDLAKKIAKTVAMAGAIPLATWCGLAIPAAGADYGQPFPGFGGPVPLDQKVDFASNWYVRGDLAYAAETYPDIIPASPSVLNTFSAGIGMGYKVNNYFRTDLIIDYRSQIHALGSDATNCFINVANPSPLQPNPQPATCNGNFDTEIHRSDLLANGYIDLGTWDGFTPYIGAGAGFTWARINQSVNFTFNGLPCQASCGFTNGGNIVTFADFDHSQSSMTYRFAWAVMAGVSIAMTDHALLDVGYRYLDLGSFTSLSSVTGTFVTQRIRANELRAGVRYMIDGI
ncbi:MAG: outer membrane protein [Methylocella sp.]